MLKNLLYTALLLTLTGCPAKNTLNLELKHGDLEGGKQCSFPAPTVEELPLLAKIAAAKPGDKIFAVLDTIGEPPDTPPGSAPTIAWTRYFNVEGVQYGAVLSIISSDANPNPNTEVVNKSIFVVFEPQKENKSCIWNF